MDLQHAAKTDSYIISVIRMRNAPAFAYKAILETSVSTRSLTIIECDVGSQSSSQ